MALLRAIRGLAPGTIFQLKSQRVLIGRHKSASDIVLNHFAVSRKHAQIEVVDGVAFIEDLRSRNGVVINGKTMQPGTDGRQQLFPSDRIEIAAFEFIYDEDPSTDELVQVMDDTRKPDILSTLDCSGDSSSGWQSSSRLDKLRTFVGIIDDLSRELDLHGVLPKIIDSLLRAFRQAQSGCVLLRDDSGDFVPAAVRLPSGVKGPMCVSRTILDEVVEHRRAVLSGDVSQDSRFAASTSVRLLKLHSVMSVPLLDHSDNVFGMIQLEVRDGDDYFTSADLELLGAIARHLSVVIENSRLHAMALLTQRHEFEARFRRMIEESSQGIMIHRLFQPLFVNEAWAALHGYSVAEVLAMDNVLELIAPERREDAMHFAQARLRGESVSSTYESQHVKKDGDIFWVEKYVSLVDWDGQPAIQTALIDLTHRKETELARQRAHDELESRVRERTSELADANRLLQNEILERRQVAEHLRESESLYRSLVDHIPLCVARQDLHGRYTFVNKAFCELFQLQAEQVVGKTDQQLFPLEVAHAFQMTDESVTQPNELTEGFKTIRLDGVSERHFHTLRTPIYGPDQVVVGTQGLFWDITSLKQAEEERNRYAIELERSNRDLEQFADSVSHDLQAPLRTITGYTQLVQQRYAAQLDSEALEYLDGTFAGAKRMKRLLDDLLDYSRVTTAAHPFRPADCEHVLREVRLSLQSQIQESEAVITHDPLPTVIGDASQLMQLFQNLIGNAILYRRVDTPRIHLRADETPTEWIFHVRDNGVGIDKRFTERIFLVFQRLYAEHERPGSGMGLSICKRIVERHGGRMWVESTLGEGSTFSFSIAKRATAPPPA